MPDLLYGRWITSEVLDSRLGVWAAAQDARAVLKGWSDSKVARFDRYLRRIARVSWSHDGARLVTERAASIVWAKITPVQQMAILVLHFVACGDVHRVREYHAHLKQLVLSSRYARLKREGDKWKTAGRAVGIARLRERTKERHEQWEAEALKILQANPKLKPNRLATLVARRLKLPKLKEQSIRKHLSMWLDRSNPSKQRVRSSVPCTDEADVGPSGIARLATPEEVAFYESSLQEIGRARRK